MTQDQRDRAFKLFHEALEKAPAERAGFLDAQSPGAEIRVEVESLLANAREGDPILATPAIDGAREAIDVAFGAAAQGGRVARREKLTAELVGTIVADRYQIVECIGKGGYAVVFLAVDLRVGRRKVVVKVMDGEDANRDWMERKFRQEIEVLAKINHPGVVGISDCGRLAGGQPFLVMNFVDGINLRERLKTPIGRGEAAEIMRQMGSALGAAHALGVVHLDLKPENIMLARSGESGPVTVKLIDFGIARVQHHKGDETLTNTLVAGTASYMAPEQFMGITTPASDIYAMGVVCFEMLTGYRPQVLKPGHELPSGVGPRLTPAFDHEPEKRPVDAEEFGNSLSATLMGGGSGRKLALAISAAAAVALIAAGVYFWQRAHRPVLTDRDVLVLADFTNKTGDPVFDGTMREALAVALEQSPFLKIMSDDEMGEGLRLTGRSPGERITNEVAREICVHENDKATLGGSIVSLGRSYAITLESINCASGEILAREQAEAENKERVLRAISTAATGLRSKLGESLNSIQRLDRPVDQVTTSSLEALHSYMLGLAEDKGASSSLAEVPFLKRAIELDPKFAMAWQKLGFVYSNSEDDRTAVECYEKAYSLIGGVTQRERLDITGYYYLEVTGELDKAAEDFQLYSRTYPREPRPHEALAMLYQRRGDFEKALPEAREAIRLNPHAAFRYANLAGIYTQLDRFAEAKATVEQAFALGMSSPKLHFVLMRIADILGDRSTEEREAKWFTGKPSEYQALDERARASAMAGRMRDSRQLDRQSAEVAKRMNLRGSVTQTEQYEAYYSAVVGNCETADALLKSWMSTGPDTEDLFSGAVALALCGQSASAERIAAETPEHYQTDILWNAVYLPTIKAAADLNRGRPGKAVEYLQSATPYEGDYPEPVYFRGLAYLRLGNGAEAASEFQKILAHKSANWGLLYSASYVGLARAYTLSGDTAKAKKAYEDFFNLWKDADPDVPLLIAARKEYRLLK